MNKKIKALVPIVMVALTTMIGAWIGRGLPPLGWIAPSSNPIDENVFAFVMFGGLMVMFWQWLYDI